MGGIIAAAIAAHVPTLGLERNTPDYQRSLATAELAMGEAVRATLQPDLWIILSSHWVATFDWPVTCQPVHSGFCVADEAPQLIPGSPYRYRGDPEFAGALVDAFNAEGVPSQRNDSEHFAWDYGTFVPMQYLDPGGEVPVVVLPAVLMAALDECLQAGGIVHAAARRLGRRAVFVASSALSHALVRGRHNWPTPERMEADRRFIDLLKAGAVDPAIAGLADYCRMVRAEMDGRPLATLLGAARAMAAEGAVLGGRQYGPYVQSSGSGNAVVLLAAAERLAQVA